MKLTTGRSLMLSMSTGILALLIMLLPVTISTAKQTNPPGITNPLRHTTSPVIHTTTIPSLPPTTRFTPTTIPHFTGTMPPTSKYGKGEAVVLNIINNMHSIEVAWFDGF